jgi:hypothetical protein
LPSPRRVYFYAVGQAGLLDSSFSSFIVVALLFADDDAFGYDDAVVLMGYDAVVFISVCPNNVSPYPQISSVDSGFGSFATNPYIM